MPKWFNRGLHGSKRIAEGPDLASFPARAKGLGPTETVDGRLGKRGLHCARNPSAGVSDTLAGTPPLGRAITGKSRSA